MESMAIISEPVAPDRSRTCRPFLHKAYRRPYRHDHGNGGYNPYCRIARLKVRNGEANPAPHQDLVR